MSVPSADQTADLWLKIDQQHLNFLKAEENTRKIDIRKRLEGFVHQYLCLVPQDRKFCSHQTSEIIWQSARWIPNFSALKAASAFEAIEKYAANLINQPWRKEFKEIKQYGGFYKHQVEGHLSGAEKMFHRMGYMSTGQETMVLSGPPDQDQLTTVARDCVLAYVECQIAVSIMQGVSAQFPCTWEEVLNFRRDHVGSPEQAVRALVYLKNQMQYHMQKPYPSVPYPDHQPAEPKYFSNGYYPQPLNVPTGTNVVPTGTLVEVAASERKNPQGQWGGQIPLTIKHYEEEQKRKTLMENGKNSMDNWDYVYEELENIGYTKDQAGGPDVVELLLSRLGAAAALPPRQMTSPTSPPPIAAAAAASPLPRKPPSPPPKSHRHSRPLQPPPPTQPPVLPQKRRPRHQPVVAKSPSPQIAADDDSKWECRACTFLNENDANICVICAKSRDVPHPRTVSQTSHRAETSLTTTSEDYRDASAREGSFGVEEELHSDDDDGQIQCGKCTLVNDATLRACEACGASLHIAPIDSRPPRKTH